MFFAKVEYCDNLIFHRRASVDEITQRLLDLNRNIGQPKKITTIVGRKLTKEYQGKLQSVIEDLDLPNPVIRSHYAHGFAKQYVRDDRLLRTEPATNNVYDYGVKNTVLSNARRIPGLKLDHPRQLAVMHSLVRFANIAAGGHVTTADLYAPALDALGRT